MKFIFTTIAMVIAFFCSAQNPWLVKQVNKYGNAFNNTGANEFFNLNGKAVFFANDSTHGFELWQSDGTANGTTLLKDITPGAESSNIMFSYQAADIVYFIKANIGGGTNTSELWRTDGTAAGTFKVLADRANFRMSLYGVGGNTSLFNVASIGSNLYIVVNETVIATGYTNIYKVDGPTGAASLYLTSRGQIGAIGASNNKVYVNANFYYGAPGTVDIGYEVYVFPPNELPVGWGDYNVARDFSPGTANTLVSEFVNVNDHYMLFYGSVANAANNGMKLMRLKGDEEVPVVIGDIPNNGGYTDFGSQNRSAAWHESWAIGDKYIFKNGFVTGGGFYFTATNGEAAGTFNIAAPSLSLKLGRTADKIILGGALFTSKVLLWDGAGANSFSYLPDALSGTALSGNFVWRAVQLGSHLVYFTSAGYEKSVFQSGVDGSNCTPLLQLRSGDLGNVVIGNDYYGWGEGDGMFQYAHTDLQLIKISGDYKIWKGASADWARQDNWIPAGVPGANDDVYIPQTTNGPVIAANAQCRSLYINTGSTVTVNAGINLTVRGDVTVAGTLTGSGALTRTGAYSNRTFGGGSTSIAQININGADIEYDVESGVSSGQQQNMLYVGSVINFKTNNKLITNNANLILTKAPFAINTGANRYFITNKKGSVSFYNGSYTNGEILLPVGSAVNAYNPVVLTGSFRSAGVRVVDSVNASGTTGSRLSYNVVGKTWLINADANAPSKVKLFWKGADELTSFNRDNCYIAHYTGGKWVYGSKQAAATINGMFAIEQDGYNSFSPFTVGSGNNILPVVLNYFTGKLANGQTQLAWGTTAESNSTGFNIQRSTDGASFSNIGFVTSAGGLKQAQAYTYTDISPAQGNNYYRLKQIDADGKYEYSKTVQVYNAGSTKTYCSIVKDVLTVNNIIAGQTIQVYSSIGQLVSSIKATGNTQAISLGGKAAGVYYVKVSGNANVPAITLTITKQ